MQFDDAGVETRAVDGRVTRPELLCMVIDRLVSSNSLGWFTAHNDYKSDKEIWNKLWHEWKVTYRLSLSGCWRRRVLLRRGGGELLSVSSSSELFICERGRSFFVPSYFRKSMRFRRVLAPEAKSRIMYDLPRARVDFTSPILDHLLEFSGRNRTKSPIIKYGNSGFVSEASCAFFSSFVCFSRAKDRLNCCWGICGASNNKESLLFELLTLGVAPVIALRLGLAPRTFRPWKISRGEADFSRGQLLNSNKASAKFDPASSHFSSRYLEFLTADSAKEFPCGWYCEEVEWTIL